MDGLSLTKEYIHLIKGNPKMYYKDYIRTVEKVESSNAKYKGKPIPFLYQPMFLLKGTLKFFIE